MAVPARELPPYLSILPSSPRLLGVVPLSIPRGFNNEGGTRKLHAYVIFIFVRAGRAVGRAGNGPEVINRDQPLRVGKIWFL